jgi:uncharacterized membrane protein
MQTDSFVILSVLLTFIAVLMEALPALTRPTIPLGVSVPASRLDEPVIRKAIRLYRIMVAAAWLVGVVLLGILAASASLAGELLVVVLFVIAQLVAYVIARQMIVKAKYEGQWYEGVRVRMAGSVTPPSEAAPVPVGWAVTCAVLIACAVAVLAVLYPHLPSNLPTHWGLDGVADRYAPKSVWTVFGSLIVGTVVVAGLFALSFLGRVIPIRRLPGVDAEANARRDHEMRAAMSSLIGRIMFVITLVFTWAAIAPRLIPDTGITLTGTLVAVLLIVVIVVLFVVRWRRLMRGDAAAIATERAVDAAVDAPDDDRYWKAGIFYVNGDDPSLFVQRRFGVGWTVNLGHPAGVIIGVAVLVLVVGLIVFALTRVATRT